MKKLFTLFLSLTIATVYAKNPADSGFTNKAEARNQTVNGLKEGKWIEHMKFSVDKDEQIHFTAVTDTNSPVYFLTIYKNDKPFGIQHVCMRNGAVAIVIPYVNGEKNGVEKWYKQGGGNKLDFIVTYKDGQKDGVERHFNEDGSVSKELNYKNGELRLGDGTSGVKKTFYPNGKLWEEVPYNAEGKMDGLDKKYNEQGILIEVKPYVNGSEEGIEKMYTDSGTLLFEIPFKNNIQNGISTGYFPNGNISSENSLADGKQDGFSKSYFENGKIQSESYYSQGKLNGVYKSYYENGKLMFKYTYTDGKRNGEGKMYYDDGTIQRDEIYDNGKLVSEKKYDTKGNEITK
jgi:antitoxin component YwqK of YwqJK toxin-antitoxin module